MLRQYPILIRWPPAAKTYCWRERPGAGSLSRHPEGQVRSAHRRRSSRYSGYADVSPALREFAARPGLPDRPGKPLKYAVIPPAGAPPCPAYLFRQSGLPRRYLHRSRQPGDRRATVRYSIPDAVAEKLSPAASGAVDRSRLGHGCARGPAGAAACRAALPLLHSPPPESV
ncbi:hypothetical protein D3C71_1616560 [compost metagenome]